MTPLRMDEDFHVHSLFSDGTDTIAANVAMAAERGLLHLGCVDHVRRDTTYLPDYVAVIRALQRDTHVELTVGVEANLLDASGTLDLPPDLGDVDLVYVAAHKFPDDAGPVSPRTIRKAIESGKQTSEEVVEELVDATIASMIRHSRDHRLVLAHLFGILPRLGLDDSTVTDEAIGRLLSAARLTETTIEVSERWRCPSERIVQMAVQQNVRLVASSDSHQASDIGRYTYVANVSAALEVAPQLVT